MSNTELKAHTDYEKSKYVNNIRNHNLGSLERVWVIGAVNGKAESFQKICNQIIQKSELRDRLVFTGNLIGRNNNTINEYNGILLSKSKSVIIEINLDNSIPLQYYNIYVLVITFNQEIYAASTFLSESLNAFKISGQDKEASTSKTWSVNMFSNENTKYLCK